MRSWLALAILSILGATTTSNAEASYIFNADVAEIVTPRPCAWIFASGQVVTVNMSYDETVMVVEGASYLLNDPTYRMVSSYRIYSDSENLSSRIYVFEGFDEEELSEEWLSLEVEKYGKWPEPYYLDL